LVPFDDTQWGRLYAWRVASGIESLAVDVDGDVGKPVMIDPSTFRTRLARAGAKDSSHLHQQPILRAEYGTWWTPSSTHGRTDVLTRNYLITAA
jgi:hypothetical protein